MFVNLAHRVRSMLPCISGLVLGSLGVAVPVSAGEFVVVAGAREFKPAILYVAPGDSVQFSKMISHNSVSVPELIPDGAENWSSPLGENISLSMEVPGIYAYVCQPHIGFGMVGLIVVGGISPEDIVEYKQRAKDTLRGPYRRLLGKINQLEPVMK